MTDKPTALIEHGWRSYRRLVVPADAPQVQVDETRQAFFAGAAILFTAILKVVSPGDDITDDDLRIMESLQHEIDDFGKTLDAKVLGL